MGPPKWYDPAPFITEWEDVEPVWVYKGIYYKVKSKLLAAMGDDGWGLAAFNTIISNADRVQELWTRGVQPEYVKFIKEAGFYICSNGKTLYGNLSERANSATISGMQFTLNGEEYLLDRAKSVMINFRNEWVPPNKSMFFIDGDYGNCRIDNLFVSGAIAPKEIESNSNEGNESNDSDES